MVPTTTRIHLFRHGAVAAPFAGRIYGDLDVPLSEAGEAESWAAAATLDGQPLQAIVHSGLARARHLAARIAQNHPETPVVLDPALREIHRGPWAGVDLEEIRAKHPAALDAWHVSRGLFAPPGGETVQQISTRVCAAIQRHASDHAGGTIAIAAHLWVLRSAACACEDGLPLHRCAELEIPTGTALTIDWPAGGDSSHRPRRVANV
tara:strand:- start:1622 stop:2242 length:621 start_codon:yes stop_codon:yes gene_type:complete